ncbi:MAG: hypothetical protein R3300_00145 [Candidatus Promineifilaceae bacterium]|nr:hypothetical protein [Candidatus Promineifilaceae bacterium]
MSEAAAPREAATKTSAIETVLGGLRFDWVAALLAVVLISGVYLDGWAHNNGRVDDSFFTPWHAVLYGGLLLNGLFLGAVLVRNVGRGRHWRVALPHGYLPALVGVVLFGFAGGADLVWHEVFGFEEDIEALLSPSHLALGTGVFLIVSASFRAAWRRSGARSTMPWPAVLALLATISIFTFFTQFANAFSSPNLYTQQLFSNNPYPLEVTLIAYVLLPTVILMTAFLLALRRWSLPPGALTLLVVGNALFMYVERISYNREQWYVLPALLLATLVIEGLYRLLDPTPQRVIALRLFAFTVPVVLFLFYFAALILVQGIWWAIHMWLGVTLMAGVVGLGLSLLVAPPPIPAETMPSN